MRYRFATVPLAILLVASSGFTAKKILLPQSAPTKQEKIDALNDAFKYGLLSRAEYDAKLRSIQGESAPSRGPATAEPPADFGPTKTVPIIDPMFQMVAQTMEIPADWSFEGVVLHGPGCKGPYSTTVYRAFSPDMRYGVQLIPQTEFFWADDPRSLPQFGNCKYMPPVSAADFAQFVSIRMRPDASIDSVSPSPDEEQFQTDLPRTAFVQLNQVAIRGEKKRVHMRFGLDGQPEEEILETKMIVRQVNVLTNISQTAMVQYRKLPQYASEAHVSAFYAPDGQLASHFAALLAISQHWHWDERYLQVSTAYFQEQTNIAIANSWAIFNTGMQISNAQAAARSQNAQNFIQNMNKQGEQRHERVMADLDRRDRHTQDVTDWILNQQLYQNPTTGQTFKASNQYKYTYQDRNGNVLQSDTIIDPNVLYHADWNSPVPIHH